MAKEIERKFLLKGSGWRALADAGTAIVQFYVATGGDRSVRVRIRNGERAAVTLKFGSAARVRDEFEYELPLDDAQAMRAFVLGRVIEKVRHLVRHGGHTYEIDVFGGVLAGLSIAELETPDDVAAEDLPDWIGAEVTGEPAYYNATLALHGLPEHP